MRARYQTDTNNQARQNVSLFSPQATMIRTSRDTTASATYWAMTIGFSGTRSSPRKMSMAFGARANQVLAWNRQAARAMTWNRMAIGLCRDSSQPLNAS